MAKRGRPFIPIDEEMLEKVEALAAQGLTKTDIALALGISYDTLARRQKDNKAFAAALETGRAKGLSNVTSALFKAAVDGNITAQIFYLKCRDPENWKDKQHIDETHRIQVDEKEIEKNMTPEEAAAQYAETLRAGFEGNVVPMKRRGK